MISPATNILTHVGLRGRESSLLPRESPTQSLRAISPVSSEHSVLQAAAGRPASAADISQRFGVRLRSLRCARDLTQESMARRFGIDRSFISDVERGRKSVSLVTLEILAIGLGVTLSELLSDV